MYKIRVEIPYAESDEITEILTRRELFNFVLNVPYDITKDPNGYGVEERTDQMAVLDIYHESDESEVVQFIESLKAWFSAYEIGRCTYEIYDPCQAVVEFEDIDLGNGWIITSDPLRKDTHCIKLNSGGSFGTGLHETTQACLRRVLKANLKGKTVLDIGTGSGILTVGALISGAESVTAVDVRDVKEEVIENVLMNFLNPDKVRVVTGFYSTTTVPESECFDYIIVNIGGDETLSMLNAIKCHLKQDGTLLVSGLVEWNCEKVNQAVEARGFRMVDKAQENEWVTLVYSLESI